MATVTKLLIRLQKFSSKISTVVDATDSFNANNNFYQDLSGWDSAVVQFAGTSGTVSFSTTNDDGAITGQLLPAPEVPTNWVSVLGVNLATKTDVSSIAGAGLVQFGIIGKYLLLQGDATTTTTTSSTSTTTSTSTSTTQAALSESAIGNFTSVDACSGIGTTLTVYYSGSLGNGTALFYDAGLTQPYVPGSFPSGNGTYLRIYFQAQDQVCTMSGNIIQSYAAC